MMRLADRELRHHRCEFHSSLFPKRSIRTDPWYSRYHACTTAICTTTTFHFGCFGGCETAADFAGILYTDAPAGGEADAAEPFEPIELEKRALLTMPGGWKMAQMHAEQPATTYAEFKREILNEIARCLNMPFNVAAGNSSGYNYASGRLDHQTYFKSIRVEQSQMARTILDRILYAWLREAILIEGYHA